MRDNQSSMLIDRSISVTEAGSSGSAARQRWSSASIVGFIGIVGPITLGLAGAAIRLDAFLRNSPLSLDEAALARNIIDRPWTRLVGWLDYSQLAPPGFLLVEKAIVSVAGSSEYALRLFPFLCALVSVWLCWAVARRLLPTVPALLAFGLFSLNTSLIDLGTRVKPYAGDVAAALWVLLIATYVFEPAVTRRRAALLALAGAATCLSSFPSVFVLAAVALAALYRGRSERPQRPALFAAAAVWSIGVVVGTLIAKMSLSPADSEYMRWFWQPAFMPFPPRTADDAVWVGHQLKAMFRWTLFYRASVVWIASAALGIWSLARRRRLDAVIMLTMPLLLVIGASAAKQYPFHTGRVALFLVPAILMLVGEGADYFRQLFSTRLRWVGTAPLIVLVALGIQGTWSGWRIQRNGDLRAPLQYVRQHWQPGDRLFVHHAAGQVFLYYAPRLGFASTDYVVSRCSDDVERAALWQMEALGGSPRVWVLVWGTDENELLFRYLSARATVRDTFSAGGQEPGDSFMMRGAAILYDLTAPRSPGVTPATLDVPGTADRHPEARSCYGVFSPWPAVNSATDR